jgi:hypothetical protein
MISATEAGLQRVREQLDRLQTERRQFEERDAVARAERLATDRPPAATAEESLSRLRRKLDALRRERATLDEASTRAAVERRGQLDVDFEARGEARLARVRGEIGVLSDQRAQLEETRRIEAERPLRERLEAEYRENAAQDKAIVELRAALQAEYKTRKELDARQWRKTELALLDQLEAETKPKLDEAEARVIEAEERLADQFKQRSEAERRATEAEQSLAGERERQQSTAPQAVQSADIGPEPEWDFYFERGGDDLIRSIRISEKAGGRSYTVDVHRNPDSMIRGATVRGETVH